MDYCKEEALIYNSAKMTLEEVIEVMDTNKDKTIVRLHTGRSINIWSYKGANG